jgi:hypothetical protein
MYHNFVFVMIRAQIFMTCYIFYLTSFSMPKVISTRFYFDYVLLLGHIFSKYLYNSIFLVIFRLIFNILLYIVHGIRTHKYYYAFSHY